MTNEEHKAAIQRLLGFVASEHQADASEILTNISDGFEELSAHLEEANANVTSLTENNEKLRKVNTSLFLRVGSSENNPPNNSNPSTNENDDKPLSFDDLFNEKGELK